MDLDDRADKVRHDHMVELVERMLELHSELNAAKTTHAKINVQRQITATDALIDKLVCELYELTPYEVKVVEGAGA